MPRNLSAVPQLLDDTNSHFHTASFLCLRHTSERDAFANKNTTTIMRGDKRTNGTQYKGEEEEKKKEQYAFLYGSPFRGIRETAPYEPPAASDEAMPNPR